MLDDAEQMLPVLGLEALRLRRIEALASAADDARLAASKTQEGAQSASPSPIESATFRAHEMAGGCVLCADSASTTRAHVHTSRTIMNSHAIA